MTPISPSPAASTLANTLPAARTRASLLAWPAWLRMAALLPALLLLWLAVAWADVPAAPW